RRRFGHRGTDGGREGKAGYEGGESEGVASAQVGRHGCAPAGFDKGVDDREDITGWVLRNEMRARKVRENPEIYGRGATAWSEIPSTPVDERTVLVRLLDIPGQVPAKELGPLMLAENVELAVADQPVVRVGYDQLALAQRHGAEVR